MSALELKLSDFPHRDCARAVLLWPSAGYLHSLTDYLEVEVYRNHRGAFWVSLHLDFRGDEFLSSWCVQRVYEDREAAASEAADLWIEGVRIVQSRLAGRTIRAPGALMEEAWEAGEGRAVTEALVSRMRARGIDHLDHERFAVSFAGIDGEARAYDEARRAWMRATDWRPFRSGVEVAVNQPSVVVSKRRHPAMSPVADAGQMGLFGEVGT